MTAAATLAHTLSIAHGVGASLACGFVFYLGGLVLLPRGWDKWAGPGESPALLGAALYVLLCWFGLGHDIPLAWLAAGFASIVLLLAGLRHRWLFAGLQARGAFSRATRNWLLTFVLLYFLAYVFTMPPVTDDFLPIAWLGNVDLMTYVRYTRYLQQLGPSNVAGYSYFDFGYQQTPAVFYVFEWLSSLFGLEPMRATMPAQFAMTALIGVFAARISQSVFAVSHRAAVAIAAILISGPFFRFVAGHYYLSTLMSMPVMLYLLWTTASCRSRRNLDVGLAVDFCSAYVLLLFLYPPMLAIALGAQVAAIGLTLAADFQSSEIARRSWHEIIRNAGRTVCAVLIPAVLLCVVFWRRLSWSLEEIRSLSQPAFGWPLNIISPLAILGLPGAVQSAPIADAADYAWAIAGFCVLALALACLYLRKLSRNATAAERTFAGLAGGAFIVYCVYFVRHGSSYQQWKFASYTALPLSFVVFAAALRLLQSSAVVSRVTQTTTGQRLKTALLGGIVIVLVGGNLAVHAVSDPVLVRFPSALRNLTMVDALPFVQELSVLKREDTFDFDRFGPVYYIRTKKIHLVGISPEPGERLSFETVSRRRPLLMQNFGCEGVGHDNTITIPGVGCLLLGPPSLALATPYPFSRTFLFVDVWGMTPRGSWGRFNDGPTVRLKLTADPQLARVDQDAYVNLLLSPYLRSGMTQQRLVLAWGSEQHGEASLGEREWISLPVRSADWSGNWLRTLAISLDLPDAAARQRLDAPAAPSDDPRPLAVAFLELSFSTSPAGREIAPAGATVH